MSKMVQYLCHRMPLFLLLFFLFITGCGSSPEQGSKSQKTPAAEALPLRDTASYVMKAVASGETVYETEVLYLDTSNSSDGYVILNYSGNNEKVKFQIASPDDVTCTYLVNDYGNDTVYPLTGGNGLYTFSLYEAVDPASDRYAVAFSQEEEITISDEFLPFLAPNVYISFDEASASVKKGEELANDSYCDLDVVNHIYHYVTGNITYDQEKAKSVPYGYIPNPDDTLSSGTGICFDYASLMSAMLRSQQIPTKLEVGYAGDVYHAWISCYVDEIGWVDNIIEFNGKSWSLLDPTLAANNDSDAVSEYIGDGSKYLVKYTY